MSAETVGGLERGAVRVVPRLRRFARVMNENRAVSAGLVILGFFILLAIFAPLLEPYSVSVPSGEVFGAPSGTHWFGLDDGGIDMLSETIRGARISLLVGAAATLVSLGVGGTIGIVSGYFGGLVETLLMRLTDFFLVIPDLVLMIVVAALWGPSLTHVIFVIGLLLWTSTARVVRSQVKTIRKRSFVARAKSLGAPTWRIIVKHVLPHVAPLLIANMVLMVAIAIFDEVTLDFLGLGSPSSITWGTLLEHADKRTAVTYGAWWTIFPPGVCIALVIIACYLIGSTLEDRLNPKSQVSHVLYRSWRLRRLAGHEDA